MDQFLSTFVNKIDRKGRVSVPADYRAVLARRNSPTLVLYPTVHYPAIEGAGEDFLHELDRRIDSLPPLSEARDDLLYSLKPLARNVHFDSEGRIVVPEDLVAHAGLNDSAAFIGLGASFQIWHPERWQERRQAALARARASRERGSAP